MSDIFTTTVAKNAANTAEIRISISSWKGRTLLHVREYVPGAVAGEWWPTSKGVSLALDRIGELLKALHWAEAEALKRGLIDRPRRKAADA
jgi:hypothetical protein